jgi:hypothetical protein
MLRPVVLAALTLTACANTQEAPDYRCAHAGQAYLRGIPLASRHEHEQAERFAPADPANCALYLIRLAGPMTGPKSSHATFFLYRAAQVPALPTDTGPWWGPSWLADPVWLDRHFRETGRELRKAEVFAPEVYAMWELPAGSYVLDASLFAFQPFAREAIACGAGRSLYWALEAKGMRNRATLFELDPEAGRTWVRGHLRSAGMQPGGPGSPGWIAWQACPKE